jgi:hypothetical protein
LPVYGFENLASGDGSLPPSSFLVGEVVALRSRALIRGRPLTYLKGFIHGDCLLNAMDRSTLYFRFSLIWLALLAAIGFALLLFT